MDLTELTTIKIIKTMKKYLYLFFVALFATMSFTLTSCGDDDDEPNGGNDYKSSFTINGTAFGTNDDWAWVQNIESQDVATFQAQLSTSKGEYPWVEMTIDTKAVKESSKGQSLTIKNAKVKYFTAQSSATTFDEVEGGSILVQDVNSSAITLKFNDYKLSDGSNTLTLNGVLKFEL
jgi:hypothetical protein